MIVQRDATPADGLALDAMAQTIWRETFAHAVSAADVATYLSTAYGPTGTLIRDLTDPAVAFRLACDGVRIVGYAKLVPPWLDQAGPGDVQLAQLYVASDHHGAGVARALLDWSVATARRRGASALLLTVWEENRRAIAFYRRHGFVEIGDYAFAVGRQVDRDFVMRLAL